MLNYLIMLKSIGQFIKKHRNKILAGVAFIAGSYFIYKAFQEQSEIKFSAFQTALQDNKINEVIFSDNSTIFFRDNNQNWLHTYFADLNIIDVYKTIIEKEINFSAKQSIMTGKACILALSTGFSYFASKYAIDSLLQKDIGKGQVKSNIYQTGTSFKDFYGGEEIKEKFMEIIDFLNDPEKYQSMGARIRRGIVFYGPPGTGKTLLARALANEAGCNFIKIAASEFQEIYAGVGPKRVRQLFREARRCKNGCIIFIDELDSLGSRMNHLRDSHQTTTTINQFLSEMDGFEQIEKIVVVGATNRMDLVDDAILRAGRFDLKIHVPLPTVEQKKGIFKTILTKKVKDLHNVQDDTIDYIADNSHEWSGADFQSLINQSIYKAIQQNRQFVSSQNVLQSFQELKALHK